MNCKEQISRNRKENYRKTYVHQIWLRARARAKKFNLDFNIEESDIIVPEYCPVYGMKLEIGLDNMSNSPCIDRIDNTKGYIKGNIVIVSSKANRVKGHGTLEEHQKIYEFYENLENKLVYEDNGV